MTDSRNPQPPESGGMLDAPKGLDRAYWRWAGWRYALGIVLLLWAVWTTWLTFGGAVGEESREERGLSWGTYLESLARPSGYPEEASHFRRLGITYLALFSEEPWHWMVSAETWRDLGIGLAGLVIMTALGWLLLRCFEVYIPKGAAIPLAFVLGVGLCGVVNTFLGLAGLLYQWVALAVLVALAIALLWAASRSWRRANLRILPDTANPGSLYRAQRDLAGDWERSSWIGLRHSGWTRLIEGPLAAVMVLLIGLITFLTFFHGVLFPETYWDSLILYLGYARGIFLQHGFPVKVVGQVGVGLGANYPHLFELTGATIATWANHWSPLYLQLATPLSGLLTLLLVYHIALRLSRSVLIALLVTLLVRAVPYLIIYHTWSSNYAFVILYSAAFFYLAIRYIEDGLPGYFILATLTVAFAMHINYLMGSLWVCWAVMVVFAYWPRRAGHAEEFGLYLGVVRLLRENPPPDFTRVARWPSLKAFLGTKLFWRTSLISVAIASIWYVRSWIVTGNPVYAFFTGIFRASKHVNPEVMTSAALEWQAHGDGIGVADGLDLASRLGLPDSNLLDRVLYTWPFFVNSYSNAWKWAPTFVGLVIPGVVVLLAMLWRRRKPNTLQEMDAPVRVLDDSSRIGLVALSYVAVLFGYHYLLGPFYLYHLFGCFAVFPIFLVFALTPCPRSVLWLFCLWAILAGFMPGLPWAMMGPKIGSPRLEALHNPGMPQARFYRLKYGDLTKVWEAVNDLAKGDAVLTHENRHLLFDPSIRLVHMDDWELQDVWDRSEEEKLRRLHNLGVRWYLDVLYERDHPINERLGHRAWIGTDILEKIYEAGGATLYRFHYPGEGTGLNSHSS
ncbi:hypothetical protein HQ520_10980 [bacterium]|nr:hypothetical protein [bacterium]